MRSLPRIKLLFGLLALAALAGTASAQQEPDSGPQIFWRIDGFEQLDSQTQNELTTMAERYTQVAEANYQLILDTLKVENRAMPIRTVLIELAPDYNGSAVTFGKGDSRTIKIGDKYALKSREDLGVIVHEMTHVVQHYDKGEHPTWLGEGIADYVRWFFYEPTKKRPHIKPAEAEARGSYRKTAAFLFWTAEQFDLDLVPKLNWALQQGTYNDGVFQQITGHSLDELNVLWRQSLER